MVSIFAGVYRDHTWYREGSGYYATGVHLKSKRRDLNESRRISCSSFRIYRTRALGMDSESEGYGDKSRTIWEPLSRGRV